MWTLPDSQDIKSMSIGTLLLFCLNYSNYLASPYVALRNILCIDTKGTSKQSKMHIYSLLWPPLMFLTTNKMISINIQSLEWSKCHMHVSKSIFVTVFWDSGKLHDTKHTLVSGRKKCPELFLYFTHVQNTHFIYFIYIFHILML